MGQENNIGRGRAALDEAVLALWKAGGHDGWPRGVGRDAYRRAVVEYGLAVADRAAELEGIDVVHEPDSFEQNGKQVGWCCWAHMLRAELAESPDSIGVGERSRSDA